MILESVNPTTGLREKTYEALSDTDVGLVLSQAHSAFLSWRRLQIEERGSYLKALAQQLRSEQKILARVMAAEMGKPITQGETEIQKCALACDFFSERARVWLADEEVPTEMKKSMVMREPLGIVFGVLPWNFPFWQVLRSALPALMAGNTFVFKHAPRTTGCGIALSELFHAAGFPKSVFTHLVISEEQVPLVIRDTRVALVTFTGSARAGGVVAAAAGAVRKKSILELGGSDPYLIFADADLESAAKVCVTSRMLNAGQICISAKRFIVDKKVHDQFAELVAREIETYTTGDPLESETKMGPLARADLREVVHGQVLDSLKQGAQLISGGRVPKGPGFFYPATLLSKTGPGMPAFDEEIFGPVASLVKARNEEELIELANQTHFGLGAALFSRDEEKVFQIAKEKIRAGSVFINAMVRSDPRLPFGGFGDSGYGRELGQEGMLEFTGAKTIVVS